MYNCRFQDKTFVKITYPLKFETYQFLANERRHDCERVLSDLFETQADVTVILKYAPLF